MKIITMNLLFNNKIAHTSEYLNENKIGLMPSLNFKEGGY